MLKLSRKVEYGLMAMLHMAELPPDSLAAAREIAERYNIPPEILGKVLQSLKRADLVTSVQGAHGGYQLQRPLAEIVVGEVIEALEGPILAAGCACSDEKECDQERNCNIKSLVARFGQQLQDFVYDMPLAARDELRGRTIQAVVPKTE